MHRNIQIIVNSTIVIFVVKIHIFDFSNIHDIYGISCGKLESKREAKWLNPPPPFGKIILKWYIVYLSIW